MGILNNIMNSAKSAAKSVMNKTSGAVNNSGNKASGGILERIVEAVYDVYDHAREYMHEKKEARRKKREKEAAALKNQFETANADIHNQNEKNAEEFAKSFGNEAYDIENANVNEIRKMTAEFSKIQQSFKNKAEEIEDKIIDFVQDSIRDMIKEFEDLNNQKIGSLTLNLNISYLKSLENSLSNKIRGYIQNSVKRNLSIDNQECMKILQIEGMYAKKKAMNNFQNEIFSEAINNLWVVIKDTISIQNDGIFSQINNRLDALEMTAKESIRQLEEIESDKRLDESKLKSKQDNLKNMIAIADWCSNLLNESVM